MKVLAAIAVAGLLLSGQARAADPVFKESEPGLLKQASISQADALAKAKAAVPGGEIAEAEIEKEDGKLIYSFDIKVAGKDGTDEVNIDAQNGALLSNSHEGPKEEAAEAKADAAASAKADDWKANYDADGCKAFASSGKGEYFVLEPGFEEILEGEEDGAKTRIVITVLSKTKKIGGIEARIVKEDETADGKLKESTSDYYAICKDGNTLLYLGEDVNEYSDGKVVGHGGSWLHGSKGAKFGVMLPGKAVKGQRYYQEQAPGVGMDRAEITSIDEVFEAPAGKFEHCLKTLESNPLEPGSSEGKIYAPGVGVVQDGGLNLVKYGFKDKK
jgi:hypothetical protein